MLMEVKHETNMKELLMFKPPTEDNVIFIPH